MLSVGVLMAYDTFFRNGKPSIRIPTDKIVEIMQSFYMNHVTSKKGTAMAHRIVLVFRNGAETLITTDSGIPCDILNNFK